MLIIYVGLLRFGFYPAAGRLAPPALKRLHKFILPLRDDLNSGAFTNC
jgi:hypothetical protein